MKAATVGVQRAVLLWIVGLQGFAPTPLCLLPGQVCTLADMDYDVYHATINANADGSATQEYYVKPRWGHPWDDLAAAKLRAMLEAAIQRRFPKGLKVHVQSVDRFGCLAALTGVLRDAGLTITRAKVGGFWGHGRPHHGRVRAASIRCSCIAG